jgi:hypothetical protein
MSLFSKGYVKTLNLRLFCLLAFLFIGIEALNNFNDDMNSQVYHGLAIEAKALNQYVLHQTTPLNSILSDCGLTIKHCDDPLKTNLMNTISFDPVLDAPVLSDQSLYFQCRYIVAHIDYLKQLNLYLISVNGYVFMNQYVPTQHYCDFGRNYQELKFMLIEV